MIYFDKHKPKWSVPKQNIQVSVELRNIYRHFISIIGGWDVNHIYPRDAITVSIVDTGILHQNLLPIIKTYEKTNS